MTEKRTVALLALVFVAAACADRAHQVLVRAGLTDAARAIGIDTVILIRAGYRERLCFDSRVIARHRNMTRAAEAVRSTPAGYLQDLMQRRANLLQRHLAAADVEVDLPGSVDDETGASGLLKLQGNIERLGIARQSVQGAKDCNKPRACRGKITQ